MQLFDNNRVEARHSCHLGIAATASLAKKAVPCFKNVFQAPLHSWQVACSLLKPLLDIQKQDILILTPSISAVSCSAEATRSPRSMLKSWCLTSEIRNLWIITSCTQKSQNLHEDAVSSTEFNLVSNFTQQTALLQVVPPGTLGEEGQEVLQGTAGPCWRSTAASGSNQW